MFVSQSFTVLDTQNGETDLWKGRPRYSGSTSVTFQVTPRWDLTARMRYRSENKSSFGGATDAFKTLDLLTSYDITDSIELYGRIVNVSDEQYQVSFGSNAPDQGVFAGLRLKL
jgi:vitamin B12 transporter